MSALSSAGINLVMVKNVAGLSNKNGRNGGEFTTVKRRGLWLG